MISSNSNYQNLPNVSIIMSVFNGEKYLEAAINSILNQTYKDYEFLIVDDGSNDTTWKILKKYQDLDKRIIAIHLPSNCGTSQALNTALKISRGEIIVRQDADDISMPLRLEKQIEYLEEHSDIGLVGCRVLLVDEHGNGFREAYTLVENDEIQNTLLDHMCICGPTFVIRRSHFEIAGFYFTDDMSYSEDYDLCLRMGEITKLHNLAEVLYHYRQHPQSVSYSKRYQQLRNKTIALERACIRRYGKENISSELLCIIARDYLRTAVLGFHNGDLEGAHNYIKRSQSLFPSIIQDQHLIEEIVLNYTPKNSIESALKFTEEIFSQLLPSNTKLRKLKNTMIARLHMENVFIGVETNNNARVETNIWKGIQHDPSWLLNRGVLITALRQISNKILKN